MSDRRLVLAPTARKDLRAIQRDSRWRWGDLQRDRYVLQLSAAMERLLQYPELDQRAEHISPGLRRYRIEHHIVYYRIASEEINVVRLLHVKMDAAAQFDAEPS